MRKSKIFIFGDSHTTAIVEAVKLRQEAALDVAGDWEIFASRFAKEKGNGKVIPGISVAEADQLLSTATPGDVLVCAIGGNQYNTLGLLEPAEPFDLIDPLTSADPEATQARIIPLAQIRAAFASFVGSIRHDLGRYASAFPGRIFYLNPPPPKADNAYIKKHAEGYFRVDGKVVLEVSPPGMRKRLWLAQSRALADLCAELGVTFVDSPSGAIEDGFLARSSYGPDATHANAHYGELVLRQLEGMLSEKEPA